MSTGPRIWLPLLPFLLCQRGSSDTSPHFPQGRPQLSHAPSCLACLSSSGGVSVPALCVMRASHSHGMPTPVRSDLPRHVQGPSFCLLPATPVTYKP